MKSGSKMAQLHLSISCPHSLLVVSRRADKQQRALHGLRKHALRYGFGHRGRYRYQRGRLVRPFGKRNCRGILRLQCDSQRHDLRARGSARQRQHQPFDGSIQRFGSLQLQNQIRRVRRWAKLRRSQQAGAEQQFQRCCHDEGGALLRYVCLFGRRCQLYNYAKVSVNGEYRGVYLALEPVEESFAIRNYGVDYGQLYKPDSSNDAQNTTGSAAAQTTT